MAGLNQKGEDTYTLLGSEMEDGDGINAQYWAVDDNLQGRDFKKCQVQWHDILSVNYTVNDVDVSTVSVGSTHLATTWFPCKKWV